MPINFTRLSTGFGKLIGALNELNTYRATTLPARIATLRSAITVDPDLLSRLTPDRFDLIAGSSVWSRSLQAQAEALLIAEVKADKNLADLSVANCLIELARQMVAGPQTYASNRCTVSSSVLTGVSDTGVITDDFDVNTGIRSDFVLPDAIVARATSTDQVTLLGLALATPDATDPTWPGGGGVSGTMTLIDIDQGGDDPGFEAWPTVTTLSRWTVVTGAVARVDGDPYGLKEGLYVCGITGGATTRLTQAFPTANNQRYLLTLWVRKTATGANTGNLVISLVDAAGTLIGTAMTVAMTAITTSWVRYTVVTQASLTDPNTLLNVSYNGGAADVINISGVQAIPMIALYTRGPTLFFLRGLVRPDIDDSWSITAVAAGSTTVSLIRGLDRLLGLSAYAANIPTTTGVATQLDALVS